MTASLSLSDTKLWIMIPCAGFGHRMQSKMAKQYLPFRDTTLITQTLKLFIDRDDIAGVVLAVTDKTAFYEATKALQPFQKQVQLVEGGDTRQASVLNALTWLQRQKIPPDIVAIHDAARPCVRQSLLNQLFEQAKHEASGVLLAEPCTQTVKFVQEGTIQHTVDREQLYLAQTPQVFPFTTLCKAFEQFDDLSKATDDAGIMEAAGHKPAILLSTSENIKVTYPQDFLLAEHFLTRIEQDND